MSNFIQCPICGRELKRISTTGHLKIHNLTLKEFLEMYPGYPTCSEAYSENLSKSRIGKKVSKEQIEKQQQTMREKFPNGQTAWNKGLTKETDERIAKYSANTSKTRIEKIKSGELIHNSLGVKRTKESKEKMSISRLNYFKENIHPKKGKSYNELYGEEKALKLKKILRMKKLESISLNGFKFPAYNKIAINFFKNFDIKNKTNGQYATNPYEFYIQEWGYWVDYINFDLNLIIEYDEAYHFTTPQQIKDKIRQERIQSVFPDFKIIRVKDGEELDDIRTNLG